MIDISILFKKATCFLITIFLLFSTFPSLQAQTTQGKEFWVTFLKTDPLLVSIRDMQIRIVTGNLPASATIYFTNLNESVSFSVNAYETYTHILTNDQKIAVSDLTTETITNHSIYISSSVPVSVYTFISGISEGATNVMPVTALGTEYYHCSYTDFEGYMLHSMDAYAVVATQNNTYLYHNGMLVTPVPLNAGEVYYRASTDMTGSLITSNNPVAFFVLHQGACIVDTPCNIYFPSLSFLMQQLAPVITWDRTFFVPVTVMETERVRIVVSQDGTNITTLTGGTIRTGVPGAQTFLTNLQAGDFVELDITSNGCFFEANNPVGVCSYMKAQTLSPVYPWIFLSYPDQVWIPGIKQTASYVLMSPFLLKNNSEIQHFALILTPTATKDKTTVSISGASPTELTGGSWIDNISAGMSFYSMPLSSNSEIVSYIFTNPQGVIILGYCVGNYITYLGYYYLAGSAMRELDAMFYANEVHFQELEEHPFCENEEVAFQAEINGLHSAQESIKWYIDDLLQPALTDHLTWSQTFPIGEYEITMWVRLENNSTVSKTGNLKIVNCNMSAEFYVNNVHYESLEDTLFCNKNVYFKADIEGLSQEMGSLKWYIGGIEYEEARDRLEWNREFETGTYPIEMWVRYENGKEETLSGILKMEVFWVKIRNVRY